RAAAAPARRARALRALAVLPHGHRHQREGAAARASAREDQEPEAGHDGSPASANGPRISLSALSLSGAVCAMRSATPLRGSISLGMTSRRALAMRPECSMLAS